MQTRFVLVCAFLARAAFAATADLCRETLEEKSSPKEYVAIVNPVSAGAAYPDLLHERGYGVISIETVKEYGPIFRSSFQPEKMDRRVYFDPRSGIPKPLLDLPIVQVLAGAEQGAVVANELAAELSMHHLAKGLPPLRHSPISFSRAWQNKAAMHEVLRRNGLPHIPTLETRSLTAATAFSSRFQFDVVVKPPASAGTDNVWKVHNLRELETAFASVLSQPNLFGEANPSVVIQKRVQAPLYIVEMIARDREIKYPFIYRYEHDEDPSSPFPFLWVDLVAPDSPEAQTLLEYADKIAPLYGIENGPAHPEIFLGDQPQLLEIGKRLGGGLREISEAATGVDPPQMVLDGEFSPEAFARYPRVYRLQKHARIVAINTGAPGKILHSAETIRQRLRALPSFFAYRPFHADRSQLGVSRDLKSMAARVELVHADKNQILVDHGALQRFVREGVFFSDAP